MKFSGKAEEKSAGLLDLGHLGPLPQLSSLGRWEQPMGAVPATSWATSIPCLGQAEWNRLWEVRYARESGRAHPYTYKHALASWKVGEG